ncbi:hypothetical protein ES703_125763 [subsurface metagenome]
MVNLFERDVKAGGNLSAFFIARGDVFDHAIKFSYFNLDFTIFSSYFPAFPIQFSSLYFRNSHSQGGSFIKDELKHLFRFFLICYHTKHSGRSCSFHLNRSKENIQGPFIE